MKRFGAAVICFVLAFACVKLTSGALRRVCYYTNWAQYRNGIGKFKPENVDPFICTHINYAFATLNGNKLKAFEWNDESTPWMKGMYERFQALKRMNPSLKTLLAVGGWNLASGPFHRMVATDSSRREFATTSITFLRKNGFDGIDLDWEYPTLRGGGPDDRHKYTLLCKVLREEFEKEAQRTGKPRLIVSAAVAAGKDKIDVSYEIPEISRYLDWINLMTYDLHGSWEDHTGENAPLHGMPGETGNDVYLNVEYAANYWAQKGAPKNKINIGMPLYGHSFTLRDASRDDINDPMRAAGQAGRYTNQAGILAYYEICQMLKNGATKHWVKGAEVPYLVQGDQWVGYDDPESLRKKVDFVKQNGFGGIMVWALTLDDFSGICGDGKYPLMHAIIDEIKKVGPYSVQTNRPQTQAPATTSVSQTLAVHTNLPQTNAPQTYPPQTNAPITNHPQTNQPVTSSHQTSGPHSLVQTNQFTCTNRRSGFYANPVDCSEYYICAAGLSFSVQCATGLHFNAKTKYCDWPRNAHCSPNSHVQQNTQPPAATTTYYMPSTNQVQTVGTLNPLFPWIFTQGPGPSSTKKTVSQQPITQMPITQMPVTQWPATQKPTTQQLITQNVQQNTQAPFDTFFCARRPDGLYSDPKNCNYYYQCAYGLSFWEPCPPGLAFNQGMHACDWAINVPNCQYIGQNFG